MDHVVWTNEQREDDLWIRSEADIQVRLMGEKTIPRDSFRRDAAGSHLP